MKKVIGWVIVACVLAFVFGLGVAENGFIETLKGWIYMVATIGTLFFGLALTKDK